MKVGYIVAGRSPLYSPAGYSVHVRSFLQNFTDGKGEIFLIRKSGEEDILNNVKIFNVRWMTGAPKLQKLCNLLFNFKLYFSARSLLHTEKPDILHEREYYLNIAGYLLAKKHKIPYILEVNAPILYEARRSFPVYRKIHRIMEKKLFAGADKIIAVSEGLKDYLIQQGVISEKIAVIPNGVDENIFNPSLSGQKVREKHNLTGKVIIGFAGSLHQEWQGIEDILEAANTLDSKKPSIVFLIAGGTKDEIKELKVCAPPNILFVGRVDHSKIPSYLAASDILIAPYKKEKDLNQIPFYNSSLKLFEYMAMGKPIIASNIGQIGAILEHKKTALLIEPGNSRELVDNILYLLNNASLKTTLGMNARTEVEENFTWKHTVRRIMDVYQEALEVYSIQENSPTSSK